MLKRMSKLLLSFLLLFDIIFASELDINEISSKRYILYNMNENKLLLKKGENDRVSVASLTKIMTAIVAIENIDNYNNTVVITNEMLKDIAWDVAVTGFKVNEKVTYNDLLYATLLNSGADAVNGLVFSVSKNTDEFVKLMNNKVNELKLKNTHFTNPIGLYDSENYSSAYDMAEILKYALKNEKFKEVFSAYKYKLSNGKTVKRTVDEYGDKANIDLSYIQGAKTGYIKDAGYCLASIANLSGVDYLLITLNASIKGNHAVDSNKIYTYYGNNYSYKNIVNTDDFVVDLKTKYSSSKNIKIKSSVSLEKYLDNTFKKDDIIYEYTGLEVIDATKKYDIIGKVKVIYNDEVLDEFDLILNQELTLNFFGVVKKNLIYIVLFIIAIITAGSFFSKKRRV